jgi:hypothetical protein
VAVAVGEAPGSLGDCDAGSSDGVAGSPLPPGTVLPPGTPADAGAVPVGLGFGVSVAPPQAFAMSIALSNRTRGRSFEERVIGSPIDSAEVTVRAFRRANLPDDTHETNDGRMS